MDYCEKCGTILHPRKLPMLEVTDYFFIHTREYVYNSEIIKCIKCGTTKNYIEERIKVK